MILRFDVSKNIKITRIKQSSKNLYENLFWCNSLTIGRIVNIA